MNSPPCRLDDHDYCARHKARHLGHLRELALGTDAKSVQHRLIWDRRAWQIQARTHAADALPLHAPPDVRTDRQTHCQACPHWQESTCKRGVFLCRHPDAGAPCTGGKGIMANLKFAKARCPLGLWEPCTAPTGPRRHLLYHVMPIRGNGVWQWNLDRLKARLSLFTGGRLVALATDHRTDTAEAVKAYLGDGVEYLEFANDPGLREVLTFLPMLERVASYVSPNDYTFYGHAKGVTKAVNRAVSVHPWTNVMYETCLDYWPLVQEVLQRQPVCGSFKKVGRGFASAGGWHYSGTFFWVRNKELFGRTWRRIDRTWWGVEAYPGLQFTPEEAGVLFKEGVVKGLNLSRDGYVKGTILPEYEQWKQAHRHQLRLPSMALPRFATGSSTTLSPPN